MRSDGAWAGIICITFYKDIGEDGMYYTLLCKGSGSRRHSDIWTHTVYIYTSDLFNCSSTPHILSLSPPHSHFQFHSFINISTCCLPTPLVLLPPLPRPPPLTPVHYHHSVTPHESHHQPRREQWTCSPNLLLPAFNPLSILFPELQLPPTWRLEHRWQDGKMAE